MFLAMNRNKLGMTLDPAAPKGREIVRKLVATADVVVANLPPAVLRSLELDLDSLRRDQARHHPDHRDRVRRRRAAQPQARLRRHRPGDERRRVPVGFPGAADRAARCPGSISAPPASRPLVRWRRLTNAARPGSGQKVEGALLRTAVAFANSLLIEQALTRSTASRPSITFSFSKVPRRRSTSSIITTTVKAAPALVHIISKEHRRNHEFADGNGHVRLAFTSLHHQSSLGHVSDTGEPTSPTRQYQGSATTSTSLRP